MPTVAVSPEAPDSLLPPESGCHTGGGSSWTIRRLFWLGGGASRPAGALEQEPGPPLALVDPVLDQAGGGDVPVFVAEFMRLAQEAGEALVVVGKLGQHVLRCDKLRVVVEQALQSADIADRAQRGTADLARALCDVVGHREDLLGLLVEQQMIVAEMRSRHVPVKILGLQIEREGVGEQRPKCCGNVLDRVGAELGRRLQFRCFSFPDGGGVHGGLLCCAASRQLRTGSVRSDLTRFGESRTGLSPASFRNACGYQIATLASGPNPTFACWRQALC